MTFCIVWCSGLVSENLCSDINTARAGASNGRRHTCGWSHFKRLSLRCTHVSSAHFAQLYNTLILKISLGLVYSSLFCWSFDFVSELIDWIFPLQGVRNFSTLIFDPFGVNCDPKYDMGALQELHQVRALANASGTTTTKMMTLMVREMSHHIIRLHSTTGPCLRLVVAVSNQNGLSTGSSRVATVFPAGTQTKKDNCVDRRISWLKLDASLVCLHRSQRNCSVWLLRLI